MTSIDQQAWATVAEDGTVLSLAYLDGTASLLGGDASAPPPAASAVWGFLKRGLDVPASVALSLLTTETRAVDGELEWWLYDTNLRAGYVRLREFATAIEYAYAGALRAMRAAHDRWLWQDPARGQKVYWLGAATHWETADETLGSLLRLRFPMRLTPGPAWP